MTREEILAKRRAETTNPPAQSLAPQPIPTKTTHESPQPPEGAGRTPPIFKIAPEYWNEVNPKKKGAEPKIVIDELLFYAYLENKGYRWLCLPGTGLKKPLIQIIDNVVAEVNIDEICRGVYADIRALPEAIISLPSFHRSGLEAIMHFKIKQKLIAMPQLNRLPEFTTKFCRDGKDHMFFFFADGVVKVMAKEIVKIPYNSPLFSQPIWRSQINEHKITLMQGDADPHPSFDFTTFIRHVCTLRNPTNPELNEFDEARHKSLLTHIGFLLHNFNDPANQKAVIFQDASIDLVANGGTGKGLICEAISKLRKIYKVDGKRVDLEDQFALQGCEPDTQIIVMDDVKRRFNFEALNSCITEGYSFERKHKDRQSFTKETSPKTAITTNYVIKASVGATYQRRALTMEITNYYDDKFTPSKEYGGKMFFNWSQREWDIFYSFMFDCCQRYLANGQRVLPYTSSTIEQKKLIFTVGEGFVSFAERLVAQMIEEDKEVSLPDALEVYMADIPKKQQGMYTSIKFGKDFAQFCLVKGLILSKREERLQSAGVKKTITYYRVAEPEKAWEENSPAGYVPGDDDPF